MQRTVKNADDLKLAVDDLNSVAFPFRHTILAGAESRTQAQNRTIHGWFGEIAAHVGDQTASEIKAECNLTYGKPILRRDDPEWAGGWNALFEPLPREKQLKAIRIFDFPFTRKMVVKQLREYMDQMQRDYLSQGVNLTIPEEAQ